MRRRIAGFGEGARMAWLLLNTFPVNTAFDFLAEKVDRFFACVVPSISFGLFAGAEGLLLYGLYMVFLGHAHGHP
jgi:hypothetical protein